MTEQSGSRFSHYMREAKELVFLILLAILIRTVVFDLYQVVSGSMETTILSGERFFAEKCTIFFSKPKPGEIVSFNDPHFKYSNNTIVAFLQNYVYGPDRWTKRVIGVPGDHIKGVLEEGHPVIYRNGVRLNEPYVNAYPLAPVDLQASVWKSYDPSRPYTQQPFYAFDEQKVKQNQQLLERLGVPPLLLPGTNRQFDCGRGNEFDIHLGSAQYWLMGDNRMNSLDSRVWGPAQGCHIHGRVLYCFFSVDTQSTWWIFEPFLHPIDFWSHVRWSRCFKRVR
jgi:signal peptidase I